MLVFEEGGKSEKTKEVRERTNNKINSYLTLFDSEIELGPDGERRAI
jgi:hypothetical protein